MFLALFLIALPQAFAQIIVRTTPPYKYAVDISKTLAGPAFFQCLKTKNYSTVFVQVYSADQGGFVNPLTPELIKRAREAGLGVEVYMVPDGHSEKKALGQVNELLGFFQLHRIAMGRVWIQVTSRQHFNTQWGYTNNEFIQDIINTLQNSGISSGIHTNAEDWRKITNDLVLPTNVLLWYYGGEKNGYINSEPNFNDFKPFAGFTTPIVKQFAESQLECGFLINKDVYQ